MPSIYLIENLTQEDADWLVKIGLKTEDYEIEVPDTRHTYCKRNGGYYEIYSYDDKTPVATLFIKTDFWDRFQTVNVDKHRIEAALKKISRKEEIEDVDYPSFEERKKLILEGNYLFLYQIPFSKLRFDEQLLVKENGFKYQGNENYYPLSSTGRKIVQLIKNTDTELKFSSRSSYFTHEEARRSHLERHHRTWSELIHGLHPLTSWLSKEQIVGYFSIAKNGEAPVGFEESDENEFFKNNAKIEFLARHKQLFQESKLGFFGCFRNTNLNPKWTLKEIIEHGMAHNNRTRQVCIEKGWLTKSGNLHENAPAFIKDAIEDQFSFCLS